MTDYAVRITQYVSRLRQHKARRLIADAALLVVTAIWGSTFVMVKDAVAAYPVFSFMALRFAFAAMVLVPFLWLRRSHLRHQQGSYVTPAAPGRMKTFVVTALAVRRTLERLPALMEGRMPSAPTDSAPSEQMPHAAPAAPGRMKMDVAACCVIASGENVPGQAPTSGFSGQPHSRRSPVSPAPFLIGLALFTGYAFQTAGLRLTTPATAGFITGLSVVLVPLAAGLILRKPPERAAWIGVTLATTGLALLTLQADLSFRTGDLLVMGCAAGFAAHILLTGHFAPRFDPLLLTLGQIVLVALLSGAAALMLEPLAPPPGNVLFAAGFTGLLATSLAFGVQTVAQRFTTATHTALIFTAEPVFAGLFSFLLIGELFGPRQLLGSGLILAGMVVAELKR